MRDKLQIAALAAILLAATGGLAFAQYAPSGDQTWAQPGQWQWPRQGYPPEPPWGYASRDYGTPYGTYYGSTVPPAPYGYGYGYGYYGWGR